MIAHAPMTSPSKAPTSETDAGLAKNERGDLASWKSR